MADPRQAGFEDELLTAVEAVHRFALSLARDPVRAEDLVQETYLKALVHRDQFEPGTNCRAWLFTICRNVFLKGEARSGRERPVEDAELEALGAAAVHASVQATDPLGNVFERVELEDGVRSALSRLPEEYRTAVTLVDVEDQSYATAAEILGVPVGTVRSRLFRGRRLRPGRRLVAGDEGAEAMISCRGVMEQLWDYLDGELPPERMQELADHLAICQRCYPQYRFEFAFLEALARQRARTSGPPADLVQRIRELVTAQ